MVSFRELREMGTRLYRMANMYQGVRIDNLPPTCMVLSAVIDGDADGGPTPIPCGNACILYDNLNAADYQEMYQIFLDYPKGS